MKRPYALKINDQWRICFHWAGGDAFEVEVCDYHRAMKPTFPHPGTLLREEFLEPMELTPYRLAREIGVPLTRITAILGGSRSVTADTGLLEPVPVALAQAEAGPHQATRDSGGVSGEVPL